MTPDRRQPGRLGGVWLTAALALVGSALEWMGVAAALHYKDVSGEQLGQPISALTIVRAGLGLFGRGGEIWASSALGIDGLFAWFVLLLVVVGWFPFREHRRLRVVRVWSLWLAGPTSALGTILLVLNIVTLRLFRAFDPEIATEGGYHRAGAAVLWWLCLVLPKLVSRQQKSEGELEKDPPIKRSADEE